MAANAIKSEAFQRAALGSERVRILGLIGVLVAFAGIAVVRGLLPGTEELRKALPVALGLIGAFIVYELATLAVVVRMIRAEREPPSWAWILNVFIESTLPTLALIILTNNPAVGPYRSLVAPAVVTYFFFIILSTLRLSPYLCIAAGVFSATGYLAVTAYTYWRYPEPADSSGAFAFPVYATYAVLFLLGGFTAGAVARQIRKHVIAALGEAETRRQMEQMKHDLSIASSIQQGLLPRHTPQIAGFEIAGWSQPADETGGDYYDWQQLPGGRLVVSLADVTGHGIGPALVTAVCRAYARASFVGKEDFGRLIDRMHRLIAEDLPMGRFVTFAAVLLDETSGSVQLLSAGHGPIFRYSTEEDRVITRNADDLPFGVVRDNIYGPAQVVEMSAGDVLVLITDGFFEWMNEGGEAFGVERLCESIRSSRILPAGDIIHRIHADVLRFAGGTEQADDLTAVVIKRL